MDGWKDGRNDHRLEGCKITGVKGRENKESKKGV
jgi:hypothetical protein